MRTTQLQVYCDFDGTVAKHDVGYRLFHYFSKGRSMELLPDWKAGRISSREILRREAEMVSATREQVYQFLEQFDLDSGFSDFVALCESNNCRPIIVSEGMDFYIKYLLQKYIIVKLELICNVGHMDNGGLKIEFPHANRHCRRCGNCKGERIAERRERTDSDSTVVFVGDGLSDVCAVKETDILFAKNDLEQYCVEQNLRYYRYTDFHEVAARMVELGLLIQ